jgi:Flp pilus assembly protein TadD
VLALYERHVEAMVYRGIIYENIGRRDDALADYRRALELQAEDDDDRKAQAKALERLTHLQRN